MSAGYKMFSEERLSAFALKAAGNDLNASSPSGLFPGMAGFGTAKTSQSKLGERTRHPIRGGFNHP